MADVKWIKLAIDIFDNRKIRQIEKMPEGDSIIVIWVKLLCVAGQVNDGGLIYFTRDIPYTEDMLATEFNRPLPTVRLALATFQRFGMVEVVDDIYKVSSWDKYQNIAGLDKIREKNRERVAAYRARKKLEQKTDNVTLRNVTDRYEVTQSNAIDIDKDIDIDKELDKEKEVDIEKDKYYCAEPEAAHTPQADVEALILNTGQEWRPTIDAFNEWKRLYPGVDVAGEFRKMRAWCLSNQQKRKTERGVSRFVNNWLSREQDRGGSVQARSGGDAFTQAWRNRKGDI